MDYYGLMASYFSFHSRKLALCVALCVALGRAQAQSVGAPEFTNSQIDAEQFYEILVGEISAQEGDGAAAFALLLDAARKANAPALFERAIQIGLAGRNGEAALQASQAWVRAFPSAPDANRYLIQIFVGLNKLPELVAPLKRNLSLMTVADRLNTIERLPRYFARATDRKQAALTVEQALTKVSLEPVTKALAWATVGQMRLQAKDIAGAVAAAKLSGQSDAASIAPAALALSLLPYAAADAQPLIARYLSANPAPEFRLAYIRALVEGQNMSEAYAQTAALNTQAPSYADGWLVRGSIEFQNKHYDAAQTALQTYLRLRAPREGGTDMLDMDRPLVTAHLLLAHIAERGLRYDEALQILAQINSSVDTIRVGARQADILARQGKLAQARALIQALPEDQPDSARAKINAEATLLKDNKQPEQGYAFLQTAVGKFPQDIDLKYDLAMMAQTLGHLDAMEQLLREVIQAQPDFHAAYNALGYSLADRNVRLPEARTLINKALEFAPEDPFIVDSLAWVEFRSGNLPDAARLLQGAFKERPDAEIAAHLGEVLWSLGQRDEAGAIWAEGQRLNSDNATLQETSRRLRSMP